MLIHVKRLCISKKNMSTKAQPIYVFILLRAGQKYVTNISIGQYAVYKR